MHPTSCRRSGRSRARWNRPSLLASRCSTWRAGCWPRGQSVRPRGCSSSGPGPKLASDDENRSRRSSPTASIERSAGRRLRRLGSSSAGARGVTDGLGTAVGVGGDQAGRCRRRLGLPAARPIPEDDHQHHAEREGEDQPRSDDSDSQAHLRHGTEALKQRGPLVISARPTDRVTRRGRFILVERRTAEGLREAADRGRGLIDHAVANRGHRPAEQSHGRVGEPQCAYGRRRPQRRSGEPDRLPDRAAVEHPGQGQHQLVGHRRRGVQDRAEQFVVRLEQGLDQRPRRLVRLTADLLQ